MAPGKGLIRPMRRRTESEAHRTATSLELFFDLVFVVAVAQAASRLHHGIVAGHAGEALVSYVMVFFAIWWAWMNFTWFASGYDNDDLLYRLAVLVQLTGALILAAGVPAAFDHRELGLVVVGYVVMRIAYVLQWLRAGAANPEIRANAYREAAGVTVLQLCWVALTFMPGAWHLPGIAVLGICELLVPVWAERRAPSIWHPEHIAERYGLFTIIVLGESILAASLAIQAALGESRLDREMVSIIAGGLLIVFAMWWLYFEKPWQDALSGLRRAFLWGYGHLLIFGSAAAVGVGIAVSVDSATGHGELVATPGLALGLPVAIFLIMLWVLRLPERDRGVAGTLALPVAAVLVMLASVSGRSALVVGLLLVATLAVRLVEQAVRTTATVPTADEPA